MYTGLYNTLFISLEKRPILAWLLKLDYRVMFFSTKKGRYLSYENKEYCR